MATSCSEDLTATAAPVKVAWAEVRLADVDVGLLLLVEVATDVLCQATND